MKRLTLKTLALTNFKGQTTTINIDGNDAHIYGDNGTGKTTIYDALCWLMFDKDSQFKTAFEIKNLDVDGTAEHNLSHEVQGVFILKGREFELKKVYSETWTKKRGSSSKEMTGHTTDHFIDGVPKNKKEYQAEIAEIATEDQFKLLTSPFYFSEKMKWQDRRVLLMDLCGDVTDEDVISGNNDLAPLKTILNGRRLDDHKKVIAARRTEINAALAKIPVRIDEVVKGMADCTGINHLAEISRIESLCKEVEQASAKIVSLENGGGVIELKQKLAEAGTELLKAKTAYQIELTKLQSEKNEKILTLKRELTALDNVTNSNASRLQTLEGERNRLDTENSNLRAEWVSLDAPMESDDLCPCCGQMIPAEKKEAAKSENNLRVANRKAEINKTGVANKARLEDLQGKINDIANEDHSNIEKRSALVAWIGQDDVLEVSPETIALVNSTSAEVERLTQELDKPQDGTGIAEIVGIKKTIESYKTSITESQNKIATVEAAQKAKDRKAALEAEEKVMSAEFEKLESELFLMENFTRAKVLMLEGKINGMFSMARFKLFADQINGGLAECCSVTYNGVPFETSLNTGARINVGLDIINTIIKSQGLSLPICVDNSESVTKLVPVDAQVIQLIVSEPDKTLRVEVK